MPQPYQENEANFQRPDVSGHGWTGYSQADPRQGRSSNRTNSSARQRSNSSTQGQPYSYQQKHDPQWQSQEFAELCRSIEEGVKTATKAAAKGLGQAGVVVGDVVSQFVENVQAAQQSAQASSNKTTTNLRKAQRNELAKIKSRFKSPAGNTALGATLTSVGALGTLYFGGAAIGGLLFLPFVPSYIAMIVGCAVLGGASIFALAKGIKRLKLSQSLKDFKRIMGTREVCSFNELSAQSNTPKKKVLSSAQTMLKRGLLPQGHIDDEQTCLIVTDEAYRMYRQSKQAYLERRRMEKAAERARLDEAAVQARSVESLSAAEKEFISQGADYLRQLHDLDVAIDDKAVSAKIISIEKVVGRIMTRAKEDPSVIDQLDRLMDYYLPTTVKLLSAYDDLEQEQVQGDNIIRSRQEIEHTLDVLKNAYEKLLDSTYKDLSMDVSSDISVLTSFLAQDGLTDGPFDIKIDPNESKE